MGESDGRREEAVSDVSFLEGRKNSRRDSASCQNRALSRARALGIPSRLSFRWKNMSGIMSLSESKEPKKASGSNLGARHAASLSTVEVARQNFEKTKKDKGRPLSPRALNSLARSSNSWKRW